MRVRGGWCEKGIGCGGRVVREGGGEVKARVVREGWVGGGGGTFFKEG